MNRRMLYCWLSYWIHDQRIYESARISLHLRAPNGHFGRGVVWKRL